MPNLLQIENHIFDTDNSCNFNETALEIFHYQYNNNVVYRSFVHQLTDASKVKNIDDIPFLPIKLFKTQRIACGYFTPEAIFRSSGTGGKNTSRHYVKDLIIYQKSLLRSFRYFFGKPQEYVVLALLPSYLERKGSSLVYMVQKLIRLSNDKRSGFYLHDYQKLESKLQQLKHDTKKVLLLGVTYALLDFAEQFPIDFPQLILMETGGMKGRRKEMVREELHWRLQKSFGITSVCSEYGMTELLSQAYSKSNGLFATPPWMKILIRDVNDPLTLLPQNHNGGINVIDFANIHSCSFIATQDLGKTNSLGFFEILGRFDNSEVRGCNLLVQ